MPEPQPCANCAGRVIPWTDDDSSHTSAAGTFTHVGRRRDVAGWCNEPAPTTEPYRPTGSPWHTTLDTIEATLDAMTEDDRNDAIEALRSRFEEIYTR